jgi:hypothetical protein
MKEQGVNRERGIRNGETTERRQGALEGVRVIELGQLLAGPFAGHLLADFGAEVIKVEAPGAGDPMREWGHHRYRHRALWWPSLARNKKSITLNLREERGRELLRRLVDRADVLLENFRAGTLERWGLGPDDLQEALRRDAREGLTAEPKRMSPVWFYDERGSELYEQITRLPEYYPFRVERDLLLEQAPEIARVARAQVLVELGSGTSEKTRALLGAMRAAPSGLTGYVGFDVSEAHLRVAGPSPRPRCGGTWGSSPQ